MIMSVKGSTVCFFLPNVLKLEPLLLLLLLLFCITITQQVIIEIKTHHKI